MSSQLYCYCAKQNKIMFITQRALKRAKPEYIMRLAKWLQIVDHKRELDDIIEEIYWKVNETFFNINGKPTV